MCIVGRGALTQLIPPGNDELGWLAQEGRVPLGYLGDQAKTERTFPVIDGIRYSVPGDRANYTADGQLQLHGRDSVTINSGGEKIFAEEVEQALAHHPAVYDAVVTGRPSERWGNEVVAIVQAPRRVSRSSRPRCSTECEKHIARYKLPKDIVFVDKVVRSPAGKADYRWAREQAVLAPERAHASDVRPSPSARGPVPTLAAMPGGPPDDATAELNPLEYLDSASSTSSRRGPFTLGRAGRIAAFVVALLLILTASVAARAVDRAPRAALSQATGDTEASAGSRGRRADRRSRRCGGGVPRAGLDRAGERQARQPRLDHPRRPEDVGQDPRLRQPNERRRRWRAFDLFVTTGGTDVEGRRLPHRVLPGRRRPPDLVVGRPDRARPRPEPWSTPTTHMAEAQWSPSVHVQTDATGRRGCT